MIRYNQTIRRQHLTNCLSVSDHFVGLVIKGFIFSYDYPFFLVERVNLKVNILAHIEITINPFHASSLSGVIEREQ